MAEQWKMAEHFSKMTEFTVAVKNDWYDHKNGWAHYSKTQNDWAIYKDWLSYLKWLSTIIKMAEHYRKNDWVHHSNRKWLISLK
jgi:hypothetical protein